MRFKKTQEEVLSQISYNVEAAIGGQLTNSIDINNFTRSIRQAIAAGVEEGFRTLLQNEYTDDDFENDVGLK